MAAPASARRPPGQPDDDREAPPDPSPGAEPASPGQPARSAVPRRGDRLPPLSAAAALDRLLAEGVIALRTDLAPALAGQAEAVHRMRTTVRRLRAVLRLFRPLLPLSVAGQDRGLRRIGRTLSAARDWDVFLNETLPRAAADGVPPAAIAALRRAGESRRRAAYTLLRRRLGGPAVAETTAALLAWTAALGPAAAAPSPLARPLAEVAPRLERRLARRVRRRGRGLEHAGPAALHALRKAVRRLRDATDSVTRLEPPRRPSAALRACRKLADRLGRLNDAAVATALAGRLAGPRGAGADPAAALSDWAARAERRALRRVPKAWKALRQTAPFRKA